MGSIVHLPKQLRTQVRMERPSPGAPYQTITEQTITERNGWWQGWDGPSFADVRDFYARHDARVLRAPLGYQLAPPDPTGLTGPVGEA